MARRRLRAENGQTMVEFAMVVPIICLILFAVVQFGMLYNDYITVTDASRVGARKAAVSRREANPAAAAEDAARKSAVGLDQGRFDVDVTATSWTHGASVTVEASYPYSIDLLGLVVSSGELSSKTTERIE